VVSGSALWAPGCSRGVANLVIVIGRNINHCFARRSGGNQRLVRFHAYGVRWNGVERQNPIGERAPISVHHLKERRERLRLGNQRYGIRIFYKVQMFRCSIAHVQGDLDQPSECTGKVELDVLRSVVCQDGHTITELQAEAVSEAIDESVHAVLQVRERNLVAFFGLDGRLRRIASERRPNQ
jgi:hypothetical protein